MTTITTTTLPTASVAAASLANDQPLPPPLIAAILAKLGLSQSPQPNFQFLSSLYRAWCTRVPFDNLRKLIALRESHSGPLPGDSAEDFFQAWLAHGTGGTCWAGNGALGALLQNLGFDARLGVATMMVAPNLPPNHGTVVVAIEDGQYIVDASILTMEPLRLSQTETTEVCHPAWGVRCRPTDGTWIISWRPQTRPERLDCRINWLGATREQFQKFHDGTRGWGPFNYELSVRTIRGESIRGIAFGNRVDFDQDGKLHQSPLPAEDRIKFLTDLGYSEEIATLLPADIPTPPPPGSRTAQLSGTPVS